MQGDNRNVAKGDAAAVVIDMLPETSSKTTAKDEIETTDEIAEGASSSLHLNVDAGQSKEAYMPPSWLLHASSIVVEDKNSPTIDLSMI